MKKNKTEDKQSLTPPLQDRHSLIGPFLWGFMALITCFGSTGCTKRLEQALEAQTAQLETLNSRLTRCEQQWQATADDFILLNQMAMRDLDTFRQEQEDLRDKIQAMDESWIVESEYVRHRQKQFQEGLVEVNTSIVATDRQIQSVQENLDTKIDDRHASLSQAIDTSNEQLALLHTRANELARDANAVQQKLRAQLTAGNSEIGEHLDTLALNQEGLQQTLDQTQTSAGLAVEQLQLVNAKQDRLAQWTQEHSEQLNQVALGESSHNQALKADTARLARHLEQLTAQHNQWTEQAGQQARQQNNQQAQLIDVTRDNSSKLDHLQFTQDENTQKQQAKAFGYYNSLNERLATIEEQGGQLGEQVTHLTQGQESLRADAESQLSDLTTNWQQQSEDVSAQLEALRQGQRELDVHDSLQQIAQQHQSLQEQVTQSTENQERVLSSTTAQVQKMMESHTLSLRQELASLGQMLNQLKRSMKTSSTELADKLQNRSKQQTQDLKSISENLEDLEAALKTIGQVQEHLDKTLVELNQSVQQQHKDLSNTPQVACQEPNASEPQ